MYQRSLHLPAAGSETFFLWGPRQTGKSTLLRAAYPDGLWIDLLQSEVFRRYLSRPELLREEIEAGSFDAGRQIIIDEVQKVPALLDEVHWLIENRDLRFALCGSSARKVRRGGARVVNQLARRRELVPRSELYGKAFENWMFHELSSYVSSRCPEVRLSYWRLASGVEVDFIVRDMEVAIEAKSSERVTFDHLKGLRSVIEDHPKLDCRIVVSREPRARRTEDGIEVVPAVEFVRRLWAGEWFGDGD